MPNITFSIISMTKVMFILVLALYLQSLDNKIAMHVEAALCEVPSKLFYGVCIVDSNCARICKKEGYLTGKCKGMLPKCICLQDCGGKPPEVPPPEVPPPEGPPKPPVTPHPPRPPVTPPDCPNPPPDCPPNPLCVTVLAPNPPPDCPPNPPCVPVPTPSPPSGCLNPPRSLSTK